MARKKLQGQVAIITGGGRGIGAAAATRLAQAGAAVVVTARSQEEIEALASRLRQDGAQAIAVPADVSDPEQVEEVVESALDQFGRVDILVNNAGVIWPVEELAETDADEWVYNIYVNMIGPFLMARNVLPLMLEQGYGRILNISSGAAQTPIPGLSAYCAAKAGLDMWTRVLALELTGTGVTANVLYPGMVDTDMQSDIRSVDTSESRLNFDLWHRAHAEGRLRSPQEVAGLIYWLVGPWSRRFNGQVFHDADTEWLAQVRRDLGE
ncbi:SDR family oxidoreductase [Litorilinea aerophila]|uniref:SDR family oxidoreductase n=1 Tax=Litorilinea aerophila TaxID=1204385 RepID=A0A540VKZ0_9CHLR|nr:SDR family oxidoreductase [Litorilinea aerophila]MCC9075076.1 SDR family oxidoreductase [Litorilinea aerophila]GIV79864.1 MAG: beta-ketoacyl-ACP reductase [Litorilinea sp.]